MIFCMISKFRRWLMAMVVFLTMCAFAPAKNAGWRWFEGKRRPES